MVNFIMISIFIAAVFFVADTFKNIGEKMVFASVMLTIAFTWGPFVAQFVMVVIVDIMSKMLNENEEP